MRAASRNTYQVRDTVQRSIFLHIGIVTYILSVELVKYSKTPGFHLPACINDPCNFKYIWAPNNSTDFASSNDYVHRDHVLYLKRCIMQKFACRIPSIVKFVEHSIQIRKLPIHISAVLSNVVRYRSFFLFLFFFPRMERVSPIKRFSLQLYVRRYEECYHFVEPHF